jgi:5-methylcytosine-specific restriction protein A
MQEILNKILFDYPEATEESFKGHHLAREFKTSIPRSMDTFLNLPDFYRIRASAGNGAWAKIPWIAIFNTLVTETVTSGFYCVYLFRADFSGVYLSLTQGIASKRDMYGLAVSRDIVKNQALYFRSLLESKELQSFSDPLDLRLDSIPRETTSRRLGLAYEAGNIVSKFYRKDKIPDNESLSKDLRKLLDIYFTLFEKVGILEKAEDLSINHGEASDEMQWFEDLTKHRIHITVERNRSLSHKVKKLQGYTCKACGFNFQDRYGDIGRDFIEAHHCVPISSLSREKIQLDPGRDFIVLCSNCHRMIHRVQPIPTLEEFRAVLKMQEIKKCCD